MAISGYLLNEVKSFLNLLKSDPKYHWFVGSEKHFWIEFYAENEISSVNLLYSCDA